MLRVSERILPTVHQASTYYFRLSPETVFPIMSASNQSVWAACICLCRHAWWWKIKSFLNWIPLLASLWSHTQKGNFLITAFIWHCSYIQRYFCFDSCVFIPQSLLWKDRDGSPCLVAWTRAYLLRRIVLYTQGNKSAERSQSPGWMGHSCSILGPVPELMGLRRYSPRPLQLTQLFGRDTPPQGIDLGPSCQCQWRDLISKAGCFSDAPSEHTNHSASCSFGTFCFQENSQVIFNPGNFFVWQFLVCEAKISLLCNLKMIWDRIDCFETEFICFEIQFWYIYIYIIFLTDVDDLIDVNPELKLNVVRFPQM